MKGWKDKKAVRFEFEFTSYEYVEPLHLSHHYTVSLVQLVNHLLLARRDSGSCPRDAPTLTMELGSPVSDVSLHW
jgi:hypothetical protein